MALIPYRRDLSRFYDPFRMMEAMQRDFFGAQDGGSISTDIRETEDAFVLEADLPGFKKDDIHIDVADGALTIQAERHSQHEEKDKEGTYLRCERSYGSYSRSFNLEGVDTSAIKAGFADGVLTLTLPKLKAQAPASRRLEIE